MMSGKEWKEFDNNEVTHSMAHYLMAIHELHKTQGYARVTDVARELEITAGSASVSIKALKAKGYVDEDRNRFLVLSEMGDKLAHEIAINNRLMIQFMVEVLGLSEGQANIDACKVEHLVSAALREKLLAFMSFIHSDHKGVKPFLDAWKEHHFECPGPTQCEVCEDGESCAIHEEMSKISKG